MFADAHDFLKNLVRPQLSIFDAAIGHQSEDCALLTTLQKNDEFEPRIPRKNYKR